MENNQKQALYESIMKDVAKIVKHSINEMSKSPRHISNRMFIKALKDYGELERKELDEILEGEPLMLDDIHEVDSMYVGRGRLYFSYLDPERDNHAFEREVSVEYFDSDVIRLIYDYLINN